MGLRSRSVGGPVKVIFEGRLEAPKMEDSGQACVPYFSDDNESENGMYVEIRSWDKNYRHNEILNFTDSRIRVTVETI